MKSLQLIALFLVLLLVTGCPSPLKYPAIISGLGESSTYPLNAAGFERGELVMYEPGMRNISIAYNLLSPDAQIAATIYVYKYGGIAPSLQNQFVNEKHQIENYHSPKLLYEKPIILYKNGQEYHALKAAYEYEQIFMHKPQTTVYSELILLLNGKDFVKLRSTSPISQQEIAIEKNLELLNAVDWTK